MESCLKLSFRRWWTAGQGPLKLVRGTCVHVCVLGEVLATSQAGGLALNYPCLLPGVTAIRPEDLEFPNTMTDIDYDTWMLRLGCLLCRPAGQGWVELAEMREAGFGTCVAMDIDRRRGSGCLFSSILGSLSCTRTELLFHRVLPSFLLPAFPWGVGWWIPGT